MKIIPTKNKAIIYTLALALTATVAYATTPKAGSEFDMDSLNRQVQNHEERLDNHEARITNTENDVKEVQTATGVAPSTNRTAVPPVTTASVTPPASATPPPPAVNETPPATVSAFSTRKEGNVTWCDLTYTDGTQSSFKWKTVSTDNGIAIESVSGTCNPSIIGQHKP